jgi:hypothetical protein
MDPAAQLQPYLRGGEQLLWAGRPDPRVWLTSADIFLIPFSILWSTFAVFWEVGATSRGGGVFPSVLGIPLVVAGLYFVFGRFVYKQYRKRRTVYGITSQRAIALVLPGTVVDAPLAHEAVAIRRSRDARHASVFIGPAQRIRPGADWFYANTGLEAMGRSAVPFAFYDVADPEIMLSALDQARGGQFSA